MLLRPLSCARQEPPGLAILNGQHRRPGLKTVLPKIRGSMDSVRGEGSTAATSSKASSPFAAAQEEGQVPFDAAVDVDALGTDHPGGLLRNQVLLVRQRKGFPTP